MKQINLTRGMVALVDDDDYKSLLKYTWYFSSSGYAASSTWDGKKNVHFTMHRLLLNIKKGIFIDHIDNNKLNNQRSNLRKCTHSQNCMNTYFPKGKSKYKGVAFLKKRNKWVAQITANGKYKYLGEFIVEEDAARAYNEAAIVLHGQFARINEVKR